MVSISAGKSKIIAWTAAQTNLAGSLFDDGASGTTVLAINANGDTISFQGNRPSFANTLQNLDPDSGFLVLAKSSITLPTTVVGAGIFTPPVVTPPTNTTIYLEPFTANPIFSPLTVTCPTHYQKFQRNRSTNKGSIVIEGSTSIADTIQARWKGGAWTDIGTVATPGVFSFNLTNQDVGEGDLEVRLKTNPNAYLLRKYVGIGALILAIGQSNMAGLGDNKQYPTLVYSADLLKAGLSLKSGWIEAIDPHSRNAGRDPVSWNGNDLISVHGSYMPIVAGYFLAQGIPVGIIHAAKSGTQINEWLPGSNQQDVTTLFGQALKRALDGSKSVGCEMILWHQGESDAQIGTSAATYQTKLTTIAEALASQLNCKFFAAKLQNCTDSSAAAGQATINAAIDSAIAASSAIEAGADLRSLTTGSDGLHLRDDLSLYKAATIWWNAIATFFSYPTVTIPTVYPTPATTPAPTGTFVTLTSPTAFQVFQRNKLKKTGSIVVSGSINAADKIEWRWRDGNWQTLITSVNGAFARVIPDQPIGQGDFEVRAASNPTVATKVKTVSIGMIWLSLGGATQAGRTDNQQWYRDTSGASPLKASLYGLNGFAELKEAVNGDQIGKYPIESDAGRVKGSYLAPLAGCYLDQNMPIAIIPVALGGVQIASFAPGSNTKDTATLFGAANSKALAASVGAGIEGVFIHVGINDAVSGTSTASYKTSLIAIANGFAASLGCRTHVVRLERSSNTAYNANLPAVNAAIDQAINENPNVLLGGNLFNLITDDDTAQFPGQIITGDANLIAVARGIFEGLNGGASIDLGRTNPPTAAIGALPTITTQVPTYEVTIIYSAK